MVYFVTSVMWLLALVSTGSLSASIPLSFRIRNALATFWLTVGHANAINHFWWLARDPLTALSKITEKAGVYPDWFVVVSWSAFIVVGIASVFTGFALANRKKRGLILGQYLLLILIVVDMAWFEILLSGRVAHLSGGPQVFGFFLGLGFLGGINLWAFCLYRSSVAVTVMDR